MAESDLLSDLRDILDRLGPGIELRVERSVLRAFFIKPEHGNQSMEIVEQLAHEFAKENECGFVYEPEHEIGTFVRAYPKQRKPT
jgi:hypothetical protein